MENITNVSIEEMPKSNFLKPIRMNYTQVRTYSLREKILSYAVIGISIYNVHNPDSGRTIASILTWIYTILKICN